MIYLLLSTYNGALHLQEQLDSLLRQTRTDWILLVRDDGSTDDTLAIIERLGKRDARIRLVQESMAQNLGAAGSFGRLLELAHAEGGHYFLFVDQDDVWHPDKIACSMTAVEAAENDGTRPVLMHSDLRVVDEKLDEISPSFFSFMKIRALPRGVRTFRILCIQNFVTGCTTCFNRAAAEAALPMPAEMAMHDWWLALCVVAADGELIFIDRSLIDYRQHGKNAVGAQGGYWQTINLFAGSLSQRFAKSDRNFDILIHQLRMFCIHGRSKSFEVSYMNFADGLLALFGLPVISTARIARLIRLRPKRLDPVRTLFLYRRLLTLRQHLD